MSDRMLTMLNECGDTTLSWTEDRDDEMQAIIEKKMAEGVTFFIVTRGRGQTLTKRGPRLEDAADARKQRALVIPDEDLAKFVGSGAGEAVASPSAPIKKSRVSRDAKEVAKSESVGVKQRRGG
jgi:tRNA A37 threonylcarbamoyladenosine synthetase subunit TsaC/SUA5/YrdC